MSVTMAELERIARLANLRFSGEEKDKLLVDLNRILAYIDKLKELDTTTVEPLAQVIPLENVFREDHVIPSLPREEALRNAPDQTDEFFKVPKVIDGL